MWITCARSWRTSHSQRTAGKRRDKSFDRAHIAEVLHPIRIRSARALVVCAEGEVEQGEVASHGAVGTAPRVGDSGGQRGVVGVSLKYICAEAVGLRAIGIREFRLLIIPGSGIGGGRGQRGVGVGAP